MELGLELGGLPLHNQDWKTAGVLYLHQLLAWLDMVLYLWFAAK